MKGPDQSRNRRFLLVLAPLLLGSVVFPAARSDAEEGMKVSATTVAEGLKTIQRVSDEVTKLVSENKAEAEKAAGAIAPVWSMIEGTIKANDQNSYTAFESAIENLSTAARDGDAKKAGGSAGALSSAVQFYVAKFPAGGVAAAPAPDRRAAAASKESAAPKESAASGERTAAAADDGAAAQAGEATLARTGPASTLTAVAGSAFGLGGLALIGGARRRRRS